MKRGPVTMKSYRNDQMWASKHKYMVAMLGISPCSYPCLKLAKMICLSYYLLYFIFNKIEGEWNRFSLKAEMWECSGKLVQCIHM
jgi:Zn-finger protein